MNQRITRIVASQLALIVAFVISLVAITSLCVSCLSQTQLDIAHQLAAATVNATDPSSPGGETITLDEQQHLEELYRAVVATPGLDWRQVAAGVLGAVGTIIPALRYLPNSWIIGKQEAAHLDKASGVA